MQPIIRVDGGRGFVTECQQGRFVRSIVITAAHCLPWLPPPHGSAYLEERTYKALLAPLGKPPTVWAECLFVDPVADIAVLGQPDNQELSDEADAYDELVEGLWPMMIAAAPENGTARVLSLKGRWRRCTIRHIGGPLWLSDTRIEGGMSGSPIIDDGGNAIGLVCLSSGGVKRVHTGGGPNPRLAECLPAWVLRHPETAR